MSQQWLIRSARNEISTPLGENELKKLIISGRLTHRDEVCPANGYWFFLHESEEVVRHLGIEISPELLTVPATEDDLTATEIDKTSPSQPIPDLPKIQLRPEDPIRNRALLEFQTLESDSPPESVESSPPPTMQVMGKLARLSQMERASIWKSAVVLLLASIVGLLFAILKVIKI